MHPPGARCAERGCPGWVRARRARHRSSAAPSLLVPAAAAVVPDRPPRTLAVVRRGSAIARLGCRGGVALRPLWCWGTDEVVVATESRSDLVVLGNPRAIG